MAGFGMDKRTSSSRGGFGMSKTEGNEESEGELESGLESLPGYLEMDPGEEVFTFYYQDEEDREEVLEVDVDDQEVELKGSDFTNADYEIFIEHAEKALEERDELDNSYTLLEQVNHYA